MLSPTLLIRPKVGGKREYESILDLLGSNLSKTKLQDLLKRARSRCTADFGFGLTRVTTATEAEMRKEGTEDALNVQDCIVVEQFIGQA